jgi:hypothetical protein
MRVARHDDCNGLHSRANLASLQWRTWHRKALIRHAQTNDFAVMLLVRQSTLLSKPLQAAVDAEKVVIKYISGTSWMAKQQTKGWITAAELQKRLDNDPTYEARMAEIERKRIAGRAQLDAEQAPILAEIAQLGITAPHMVALFNLKERNPKITEILLPKLLGSYREGTIDSCLRVMEAAGPCPGAIEAVYSFLLRKLDEVAYALAGKKPSELLIGQAMAVILSFATEETLPLLEKLLADSRLADYQQLIRRRIKQIVSPASKGRASAQRKKAVAPGFWRRFARWLRFP